MPGGESKDLSSGILLLSLAIENRKSKFGNSDISREHAKAFGVPSGGIAQLVERQLCKLEVRVRIPLPPAYASSGARNEGCHAGAKRRRALFC